MTAATSCSATTTGLPSAVMHLAPAMWWMPAWLDKRLPHLSIERPDDEPPSDGGGIGREPAPQLAS